MIGFPDRKRSLAALERALHVRAVSFFVPIFNVIEALIAYKRT